MKSKLAIVGTNGLPCRYGGWDNLMLNLLNELGESFEIEVYTSKSNAIPGVIKFMGAQIKIISLRANGWQSVFYDGVSLLKSLPKNKYILVLGTSGAFFFPLKKLFNAKIILNPDGAEWKRGKWNFVIQKYLKLSERISISYSDCIISDNLYIQEDLLKTYKKVSHLVPYGGNHVTIRNLSDIIAKRYNLTNRGYAITVARIEPENNIELILEAFSKSRFKYVCVGNWDNSVYGRNLRIKYAGFDNLILVDPIYNQNLIDELRSNAFLYVHGHSVGGSNPSLIEAMCLKLPCLVYRVNYNVANTFGKALYFSNLDNLKMSLAEINKNKNLLNSVSDQLFESAKENYQWNKVVNQYKLAIIEN